MQVEEVVKKWTHSLPVTMSNAWKYWIICVLYSDNCTVLCAVFVGKATLTSMSLELFICDSFAPIF